MKLKILYEDNHLLVIDKPAGWIVQGAREGDHRLLDVVTDYLRHRYQKPGNIFVGVVSRLDRGVTGVLPLAKTSKAAARLSRQFQERTVDKRYWALVAGSLPSPSDRLHHWLVRDERLGKTICLANPTADAVEGILDYRVLDQWKGVSWLEIRLETGRKHQIRAQLEEIGNPILGDGKYGSSIRMSSHAIALHCRSLELEHPTLKRRLTWSASLPASWRSLVPAASFPDASTDEET